jgi:phosphoribosylcarboxyaminoimidazole (NCAIR) mutase
MYRKIIVAIALGGIDKGEKILRKAASLLDAGGVIIALNVVEDVPSYVAIELPANMVEDAMKDGREKLEALIAAAGATNTIPASAQARRYSPLSMTLACVQVRPDRYQSTGSRAPSSCGGT